MGDKTRYAPNIATFVGKRVCNFIFIHLKKSKPSLKMVRIRFENLVENGKMN